MGGRPCTRESTRTVSKESRTEERLEGRGTYLGCTDLVEGNKGESLSHHTRSQVLLSDDEGDEQAGKQQLWDESKRFGVKSRGRRREGR